MPAFSTRWRPNRTFEVSPFLFWAIIAVASRHNKSAADTCDLKVLCEKACDEGLLSLRTNTGTLPHVKGLLIMLTWAYPTQSSRRAATHAFAGSLVHIGMQLGLHIPASSQDFSRTPLELSEYDISRREGLWAYCIVTYQRYSTVAPAALTMCPVSS